MQYNMIHFIDSLTLMISFATSTVKLQDLQLTREVWRSLSCKNYKMCPNN